MTAVAAITLDEAKERIRRLAEERPDYVYEPLEYTYEWAGEVCHTTGCRYFDQQGTPSCIIGHAFADELREAGVGFENADGVYGLAHNEPKPVLSLETDALDFLMIVQRQQDTGIAWGDAYRKALDFTATR